MGYPCKAAFLVRHGKSDGAFEWRDHVLPELQSDELLIETEAFGLNFADVLARNGLYREAPPLPSVLGYDLTGRVVAVGVSVDPSYVGKRIAALTRFGAYATHAIARLSGIAEVPEEMSAGEACALGTQYATAYYSAHYIQQLHPGDRVLIHAAAGGVGTALLQMARNKGCEIFATVGSDEKKEELGKAGIKTFNYHTEDYEEKIKAVLKGDKLDISFNSIAGTTFKKDMRLLGASGRLVLYGFAERSGKRGGKWATLKLLWSMGMVMPILLMAKSKSMIGVNMLKIADHRPQIIRQCLSELVAMWKRKEIEPFIGAVYTADQLAQAHDDLENRKIRGKSIVVIDHKIR